LFELFCFTEEFAESADDTATNVKDDLDRDILENGKLCQLFQAITL